MIIGFREEVSVGDWGDAIGSFRFFIVVRMHP